MELQFDELRQLIREGERCETFYVVLSGSVAIVEGYGTPDERLLRVHGPGRFIGELGLLNGQVAFYTAVVRVPGEVLALSMDQLRDLVTRDSALGDVVLRACLGRRALLVGCRTAGSIWRPTRRPRNCCAASASARRRHRSSSGGTPLCCATPATRNWPGSWACRRCPPETITAIS